MNRKSRMDLTKFKFYNLKNERKFSSELKTQKDIEMNAERKCSKKIKRRSNQCLSCYTGKYGTISNRKQNCFNNRTEKNSTNGANKFFLRTVKIVENILKNEDRHMERNPQNDIFNLYSWKNLSSFKNAYGYSSQNNTNNITYHSEKKV